MTLLRRCGRREACDLVGCPGRSEAPTCEKRRGHGGWHAGGGHEWRDGARAPYVCFRAQLGVFDDYDGDLTRSEVDWSQLALFELPAQGAA